MFLAKSASPRRRSGLAARGTRSARALAGLVLAGCLDPDSPGSRVAAVVVAPVTVLEGVTVEGYAEGRSDFRVFAERASLDPEGREARLTEVTIAFADRTSGDVSVRADEAHFWIDREDFELRGDVRGRTAAGETFETEALAYDDASRSLRTDAPVRLRRSDLSFEGRGMELDVASRRVRFSGRVSAVTEPE
jgi:LPS export ABC transporter protein LptC